MTIKKIIRSRYAFFLLLLIIIFYVSWQWIQAISTNYSLVFKEQYPHLSTSLIPKTQYKIPDLENTLTMDVKTHKPTNAENMIPQGLAFSNDFLFISAYSADKKYNSVIYVLDKHSGSHKKTIVLPDLAHAGGLAYDPISNNLWLTTETADEKAKIAAFSVKQIKEYDFEHAKQPLAYRYEIPLKDLPKASFLAYHESNLIVGHFKKDKEGTLVSYPLDNSGLPHQAKQNNPEETRGIDSKKEKVEIVEKIQGVSFFKNQILFSQSYGETDSQLFFLKNDLEKDPISYKEEDFSSSIDFPPYMEQIVVEKENLFVLFESAASEYRNQSNVTPIDEVLVFDLTKLKK